MRAAGVSAGSFWNARRVEQADEPGGLTTCVSHRQESRSTQSCFPWIVSKCVAFRTPVTFQFTHDLICISSHHASHPDRFLNMYRRECKYSRRRPRRCTPGSGTRSRGYRPRRACARCGAVSRPSSWVRGRRTRCILGHTRRSRSSRVVMWRGARISG